jgi:hypothetical protein
MTRIRQFGLAAVLFLVAPAMLLAGGPPWVCLPIEGVNEANAKACAKQLASHLGDRVDDVMMRQSEQQWYAVVVLDERRLALSDVQAALAGSGFRVPTDQLRLFGHVTLEVDSAAQATQLREALNAIGFVSVEAQRNMGERMQIKVDMPYPHSMGRSRANSPGVPSAREVFHRNDFASDDKARRSEPDARAKDLPSYTAFRDVIAEHGGQLLDVSWDPYWGCRMLGCVTAAAEAKSVAAK